MKKILVPVDFSKASLRAAQYAGALALKLEAEIDILHVINIGDASNKLTNWQKLEAQMIKSAKESATDLMDQVRYPVTINYHHTTGYPIHEAIQKFASEHKHDLVVIGTHGASGIKKAIVGSNAAALIGACSVPVISVPAEFEFGEIKNILYATSMVHLDEEIKTVSRFARNFDSQITIVHVSQKGDSKRDYRNLLSILSRMSHYDKLKFEVVQDDDVEEGLRKVAERLHPDLIVLFTHELSLYEKIFGKGVTRNVVQQATIPLLSYNRLKKD